MRTSDDWERLQPEQVIGNLLRVGIALTLHELVKPRVLDAVRDFYTFGFNQNGPLFDEAAYEKNVRSLDRNSTFDASLQWLKSLGAITDADIETLDRLFEYRKAMAHESSTFIVDPDFEVQDDLIDLGRNVLEKLGRFWARIDIEVDPEMHGREIADEDIRPAGLAEGASGTARVRLGRRFQSLSFAPDLVVSGNSGRQPTAGVCSLRRQSAGAISPSAGGHRGPYEAEYSPLDALRHLAPDRGGHSRYPRSKGILSPAGDAHLQPLGCGMSRHQSLLSVVKSVIRQAAKVGLEHAGTLVLGPAWPAAKAVMQPVIRELERRFPRFSLLETQPGKEAETVAEQAIAAIDADLKLQELLREGFAALKSGQQRGGRGDGKQSGHSAGLPHPQVRASRASYSSGDGNQALALTSLRPA